MMRLTKIAEISIKPHIYDKLPLTIGDFGVII